MSQPISLAIEALCSETSDDESTSPSPISSDVSLASVLCGHMVISQEKKARVESITRAGLGNPVKSKVIEGFTTDSVSSWHPVIWETINRVPEPVRKRAFRHSSICIRHNYEDLEWVGDTLINANVVLILFEQLGAKHLAFRNVIRQTCLNKVTMNAIGRSLGLDKHIQSRYDITDGVCEDVFEAVAAAIYTTLGHEVFRTYIEAIYDPVIATLRRQLEESGWEEASLLSYVGVRGHPLPSSLDFLSKLKELCESKKWTLEVEDLNEMRNSTPRNEVWIQHVVVNGTERATGEARTKRMARVNAAEELYHRLSARDEARTTSPERAVDQPSISLTTGGGSSSITAGHKGLASRTKRPRTEMDDCRTTAPPPKCSRLGSETRIGRGSGCSPTRYSRS